MAEEKRERALRTYQTLCQMLDSEGWHYDKDDERLSIYCTAQGEDLPIDIRMTVNEQVQTISLISRLPFVVSEEKRMEVAVASTVVNNRLVDGSFDFDLQNGRMYFRITNSFMDCELSKEAFRYILFCACGTIDDYNDKFLMLDKGMLTLESFMNDN